MCRNYRCRTGEIDLVARDGEVLVFVEVKARRGRTFGSPEEAVNLGKQRRLRRLAACYLAEHRITDGQAVRFDVVAVEIAPTGRVERVELLRDAF